MVYIPIYGNIYHQYTPNVSIYTIHGSYGFCNISSASKKPSRVSQVVVPPRSSRQSTASALRPAQCGTQLLEPDPTKIPGGLGQAWSLREF